MEDLSMETNFVVGVNLNIALKFILHKVFFLEKPFYIFLALSVQMHALSNSIKSSFADFLLISILDKTMSYQKEPKLKGHRQ